MTAAAALASKFGNKFEETRCTLASLDVGGKQFLGRKCLPASDDNLNRIRSGNSFAGAAKRIENGWRRL